MTEEQREKWRKHLGIPVGPPPTIHEAALEVPGVRWIIEESLLNTIGLVSAIVGDALAIQMASEALQEFKDMIAASNEETT